MLRDFPSRGGLDEERRLELKGALLLPEHDCESSPERAQAPLKPRAQNSPSRRFRAEDAALCEVPVRGAPTRLQRLLDKLVQNCRSVHLHAFVAPLVLLCFFVLWGCVENCYGEDDCPKPRSWFNNFLVAIGPLLPLLVLLIRVLILPYSMKEVYFTLLVWLTISGVRLLLYINLMQRSGLFSDHIFLMTSILAMVQTEIAYAHRYVVDCRLWALVPLTTSYLFVWFLCEEAYATAAYYHSVLQSVLALALGVTLFSGMALGWQHYRSSSLLEDDSCREDLEDAKVSYKAPSASGGSAGRAASNDILEDEANGAHAATQPASAGIFEEEEEDEVEEFSTQPHQADPDADAPYRTRSDDMSRSRRGKAQDGVEVLIRAHTSHHVGGSRGDSAAAAAAASVAPEKQDGASMMQAFASDEVPPAEAPKESLPPSSMRSEPAAQWATTSSGSWAEAADIARAHTSPAQPRTHSGGSGGLAFGATPTFNPEGRQAPPGGTGAASSSSRRAPPPPPPIATDDAPAATIFERDPRESEQPLQKGSGEQLASTHADTAAAGFEALPVLGQHNSGSKDARRPKQPACCAFLPGCRKSADEDGEEESRPARPKRPSYDF